MPTLSVVIPTMNEEGYLPRLLRSIKKQSFQPHEIIVADAGSVDRTKEIATSFDAKIIPGGMPGEGRNRGAEAASGDLIFFFDADVLLEDKRFLEKAVREFEERELDLATADVVPIAGTKYDAFAHEVYNKYVRMWGRLHPHAPGFCMLVKRSLHEQINGFDEEVVFCEDHDYAIRGNKVGRFGFLSKGIRINVSSRRQERDGRFNMSVKYILAEFHIWLLGPIKHNGFNYTFGHSKKK